MKKGSGDLVDFWNRNKALLLLILIIFFFIDLLGSIIGIIIGVIQKNSLLALVFAISAFVAGIFLFAFWRLDTLR